MEDEKNHMPHPFWNDGFRCGVNVYTELLNTLLRDLATDKKKLTPSILQKFNDLMIQNKIDIHYEFYDRAGFRDSLSPFIRLRRDMSDKKNTVIEWYDPKRKNK